MAQHQFTPSQPVIIGRPLCRTCGVPMWLTRIDPHSEDHDERTFECSLCKKSETTVVKFK